MSATLLSATLLTGAALVVVASHGRPPQEDNSGGTATSGGAGKAFIRLDTNIAPDGGSQDARWEHSDAHGALHKVVI